MASQNTVNDGGGGATNGGGNIKVVVRCRPFNSREKDRNAQCIVQMKDNQTILTPPSTSKSLKKPNVFAFDHSYWSFDKSSPDYAGQDSLHRDLGQPLLDNAFQGYNNCIFAYGQTGSGKSYSMMGYDTEHGVIPKICQNMFERITALQQDVTLQCTVEVSYLEIYNEKVRDLLNPSTKGNLKVREHPSTGPYVEDLAKLVVGSFHEIEHLMDEGNKARTVAATNMNETSSRSHAVFTLTLTQKRLDVDTQLSTEKVAKISLVDLAGSERANSTGATGARLREGAEINRSLSTLGRVIAALADLSTPAKKRKSLLNQVPYRDSVLTWLLKDSLGGNSMTAMIAAISPADINYEETLSTLRYADRAKRIKNHAVINEDANARMVRELKEELATLRTKLASGNSLITGELSYPQGTPLTEQFVEIAQDDGSVKKVSKAEIQEQLTQSEKLYSDLNQTWEEKLTKTEEIHKEREAVLEELGISIEKGVVGLHVPKKMPHLVNLSDDPLLSECLVYNLKPGRTTVGNVESDTVTPIDIRLNGSQILPKHCTFVNDDNRVTVIPQAGAAVMVNGKRISEPTRLRSGHRTILGDFHIFRFNHPMEAKAERTEKSLLRHSVTVSQLAAHDRSCSPNMDPTTHSPSSRFHERNASNAESENDWDGSRPDSPNRPRGKDFDWFHARREAAGAILGTDQKIAGLTDDELNVLFENVQRARAERQGDRYEDDTSSTTSYPVREKYLSAGTLDSMSLDSALTTPSTPRQSEVEDKTQEMREEMLSPSVPDEDQHHNPFAADRSSNVEIDELKKEKEQLETTLQEVQIEMQEKLEAQQKAFDTLLRRAKAHKSSSLSELEVEAARKVVFRWRNQKHVGMIEAILQNAACLKEAQIMYQDMNQNTSLQFVVLDTGQTLCSSYDMIFVGEDGDGIDEAFENSTRPCVAVRVMDHKHNTIYHWSLTKLQRRVRAMKQSRQDKERLDHIERVDADNFFPRTNLPRFSLIGDVHVPLAAVFQRRVQDLSLDVTSPYTHSPIGRLQLALEPSSSKALSQLVKFNVVLHNLQGFSEDEGTDVHAQLTIYGLLDESGITTTQMIKDFGTETIKFESTHNMSVPKSADPNTSLRVAIFARVSSVHLQKLRSWDEMRDPAPELGTINKTARLSESQFISEQVHDVFAKIQILEIMEDGTYEATDVIQPVTTEKGSYQMHQGLQRRIVITLSHGSGQSLQWADIRNVRVGHVSLVDNTNKDIDASMPTTDVMLPVVRDTTIKHNANGTTSATITNQWDSSLHNSLLLDQTTVDRPKIKLCLLWDVISEVVEKPISFSMSLHVQILPRNFVRQPSYFESLFGATRIARSSTALFCMSLKPAPRLRASDLWRVDTSREYVKGEESLVQWRPRGVSVVHDFIAARKRKIRLAEVEHIKSHFGRQALLPPVRMLSDLHRDLAAGEATPYDERQQQLLRKYLGFWTITPDTATQVLQNAQTTPPQDGISTTALPDKLPHVVTSLSQQKKSHILSKSGHLLVPSSDNTKWARRYVELRQPYLYIHSLPDGEETGIISLRGSRVNLEPQVTDFLASPSPATNSQEQAATRPAGIGEKRKKCIFAIYGERNSWLLCAPSEKAKMEWIWAIDEAYNADSGGVNPRV